MARAWPERDELEALHRNVEFSMYVTFLNEQYIHSSDMDTINVDTWVNKAIDPVGLNRAIKYMCGIYA